STIAGNQHAFPGAGIAGAISLLNTIVADNFSNCAGVITSLGHNLSSDNSCNFAATGDMNNANPKLGSLRYNGGPTLTRGLLPGSLAIDAGDNNGCPPTDQRSVPRLIDGDFDGFAQCDIGAYEFDLILSNFLPVI